MNEKGNLSINSENFLPIIKKWLYTDKDIFIRELVSNACDAVTKLKKLMIMGEADHIPADEAFSVHVVLNKEEKIMQIVDNGIGMTKEYQERIFEPFSRADDVRAGGVTGTGLGMTIVLDILNMLDGKIDVESEPAKGTRFIVTVRLARNRRFPILDTQTEVPDQTGFYGLRVLVAEDNELNRQIAGEMLALLGVEAEMAPDGFAALEAVRTHPPYYYDMMFLAIQRPVLYGYAAARQFRGLCIEHIVELPIVAMTADAFTEDVKQARLAGMCAHIAKPISMEQLRRALSSCVRWKKYNDRN